MNFSFLEPETFTETYNELVEFTRRCGIFSSLCYGYRFETFTHRAIRHVTKTRTKGQCCQGYMEKQNICIPICTVQCINGQCTEPNTCTCDPGYESSDRSGRFVQITIFWQTWFKHSKLPGAFQNVKTVLSTTKTRRYATQFVMFLVQMEYALKQNQMYADVFLITTKMPMEFVSKMNVILLAT